MKYILSLDASTTCTGYAIFSKDKLVKSGKIVPSKVLDWRERINHTANRLNKIIEEYDIQKIYCEDVPLKSSGGLKTLLMLGAVQGMILTVASCHDIEIEFIPVATWRRKVGLFDGTTDGKKRENLKKHSIELANKLYKLELNYVSKASKLNDDDISDAILIYHSTLVKTLGRKSKV